MTSKAHLISMSHKMLLTGVGISSSILCPIKHNRIWYNGMTFNVKQSNFASSYVAMCVTNLKGGDDACQISVIFGDTSVTLKSTERERTHDKGLQKTPLVYAVRPRDKRHNPRNIQARVRIFIAWLWFDINRFEQYHLALLYRHCDRHAIMLATEAVEQPWWIWVNCNT